MKVHHFESHSEADTLAVGAQVAGLLRPPALVILQGDLGSGKTTLVKGIVHTFGAAEPDEVTSPTFTLIHQFEGQQDREDGSHPVQLYHLDLYRIDDERQLDTLGVDELTSENSIVLIEWGEKFPTLVKRSDGFISIEQTGSESRKITLKNYPEDEPGCRDKCKLRF